MLDGKTFAEDAMVLAVGVTANGQKIILGMVQTATENRPVCSAFLQSLLDRGLRIEAGLLVVIDGAKGLRAAVQAVFGVRGIVQRCQWHKRENVVRYLPRAHQAAFRRKLQAAYERATYDQARRPPSKVDGFRNTGDRINTIRVDFRVVNETDSGHPKTDEARWMRFTLDTVGRTGWPRDAQGRPIYPEGFEELLVKRGKPLHPRLRTTAGRSRVLSSRFARTHRKVRRPRFPATRRAVDRVQQRTSTTGRAKTFAR